MGLVWFLAGVLTTLIGLTVLVWWFLRSDNVTWDDIRINNYVRKNRGKILVLLAGVTRKLDKQSTSYQNALKEILSPNVDTIRGTAEKMMDVFRVGIETDKEIAKSIGLLLAHFNGFDTFAEYEAKTEQEFKGLVEAMPKMIGDAFANAAKNHDKRNR